MEEAEAAFNAWNRQQTTGLIREELYSEVSVHDSKSMLLIVIDLNIDRDKVDQMPLNKWRKHLKKLLKRIPC
jgi:hypothetical protein